MFGRWLKAVQTQLQTLWRFARIATGNCTMAKTGWRFAKSFMER